MAQNHSRADDFYRKHGRRRPWHRRVKNHSQADDRFYRITLHVPSEFDQILEEFAEDHDVPKWEALRRAVNLLDLVKKQKAKGRHLAFVSESDQGQKIIGKVSGI